MQLGSSRADARIQKNHIVRRVSLRSTRPTFELLEAPLEMKIKAFTTEIAEHTEAEKKDFYAVPFVYPVDGILHFVKSS
ncbi:MAG: hypothetical protein ACYC9K_10600 [Sulfuricaulis sp.]